MPSQCPCLPKGGFLQFETWLFSLQKTAFYTLKAYLLHAKRPPFGTRHLADENCKQTIWIMFRIVSNMWFMDVCSELFYRLKSESRKNNVFLHVTNKNKYVEKETERIIVTTY